MSETPEKYCSQLAAQAWKKIASSTLVEGKKIGRCPKIVFKKLEDNINGRAYPEHIELNISRLESPDREVFLYKTTLHEVAHVAEYRIAGVMTHGPLWHALDDLIDGDGLQFSSFRPQENFWEELFISIMAVTVLLMMTVVGAALLVRYHVWWSYIAGTLLCGIGVIGLLAGLGELIKYLNGEK
jgi:predicted SprT family Zn-dependent metalloprotease